jgi:tetratricopeptide (TPR) repeat protein
MAAGIRRTSANILWIILGLALVFVVVAKISNRPPTSVRGSLKVLTPPFTANKGELIQELRDRKFQVLDTKLNSYQKAFEQNVLEEGNLSLAFEAFTFTDPALRSPLDDWIKNEPNSYPAHLARAKYLIALGWQARGSKFTDKTTVQQFNEMTTLLVEGAKEAIAAVKLNVQASIAYASIIDAARGVSDTNAMRSAYAASLKNVPLSLSTRVAVMNALEPRWGGSYDAMTKFAADAQKYAAQNPRLVSLKGFADEDAGHMASVDSDWKTAIGFFNKALADGGDFARAYESRAWAYYWLGRYDDALEDVNRSDRLRPQNTSALELEAYVYFHLNRPQNTLAVIEKYRQFEQPGADLVSLERRVQNFAAAAAPPVQTGGN